MVGLLWTVWLHYDTPTLLIRLTLNREAESATSSPELAVEKSETEIEKARRKDRAERAAWHVLLVCDK